MNNIKIKSESDKCVTEPARVALIYCRVSSERQKNEGHGLDSQESRCRIYADQKGYKVEKVFRDSYTGGGDFMLRPAMKEMLSYVDSRIHKNYVVIFDDLKRFARDTEFHLKLRAAFYVRKLQPECLNYTFDESPEGRFVETVFAAQGQLEREQNKRQVVQKQKARMEAGYWTFYPPTGYIHKRDPLHGKLLMPTDKALVIKQAFEGFASGRFKTQVDVMNFLQQMNFNDGRKVHLESVKRLLRRIVYAGYIEYPKWNIARRKGHHEAIISLETYQKVQDKLGNRTFNRVIKNEDFPLRGLIFCSKCKRPLTAGWTKGRSKKYPYYRCQHCYCLEKDVRREVIEGEFEKLLSKLNPKPEVIGLIEAVISDVWNRRKKDQSGTTEVIKKRRSILIKDRENLLDTLQKTNHEAVLRGVEDRLEKIDLQVKELDRQIRNQESFGESYGTATNLTLNLLKDPVFTWQNGGYNGKRLVTKLVFVENPVYDRMLHYGTAELSLGIKLFELISTQKVQDVEMRGIEPRCKRIVNTGSTLYS